MSRVYLALAEPTSGLPRLVVAKVLLGELTRDAEFVQMFLDEARLCARLDHPNVIKTFDVDMRGDDPYILLEYLDGASLDSLERRTRSRGGIPLALHLHAIAQTAHGLHYAHDLTDDAGTPLHIIHRDVSPQNVFVTFEGGVKVLDFGIAKAADSSHTTKTGVVKGKFAYMAPEQLTSGKQIDRRVDVFALGVMTWQAAAKRRPWAGLSEVEIVKYLLHDGLPSPSTPEAPVDDELVRIIQRATTRDRDARYATAAEFVNDLERYLAKLPEKAGPRRLGAWASEVMVERRTKVAQVIDSALRGPTPARVITLPPLSTTSSSLPLLTPTPLSSFPRGSFNTPAQPSTEEHRAPPATVPPSARGGTAIMASPAFDRKGPESRSARTDPTAVSALAHHPAAQSKRSPVIVAVAAVAVLAVGGAMLIRNMSSSDRRPADIGASSRPSVAPVSAVTELQVTATPAHATFFIDGAPIAGNPVKARFPRDGSEHELRVEATGFRPASQKIRYDEATKNITIVLAAQD